MNNKKLSVTIGIPAYNEEKNIARLLKSLLRQNISNYIFNNIVVICDGCNDATSVEVRKVKSKFIRLIEGKTNKGKIARLNQLFRLNKSDLLIVFDADIGLANDFVIYNIVKAFQRGNVSIVAGKDLPYPPDNLFGKVICSWTDVWNKIRWQLREGDNVHNLHGSIFAATNKFTKSVYIPPEVVIDDQFLYLIAKKKGFRFGFASSAIIYYKTPSSVRDYITQSSRYLALKSFMVTYFGKDILEEYKVPLKIKFESLVVHFLRNPLYLSFSIAWQVYLRMFNKSLTEKFAGNIWVSITSTK
jgi:cellulose synthase/poly-beta-1,6-N-acetylglucosamine synthase-like glycosyltransferase